MALLKIKCPECSAGLKSPTGFKVGQNVRCPKCETYFAIKEPDDESETDAPQKPVRAAAYDGDDEDVGPRKKKMKRREDDDDERSYKSSPLRYAVLGVLVVVMLVLGYMLYEKRKNEAADNAGATVSSDSAVAPTNPLPPPREGPAGVQLRPNPPLPGGPVGGPPARPPGGAPLGGLFGGVPLPAAEANALKQKLQARLLGNWAADLGDGYQEELTYAADGTYTAKLTGATPATATGRYTVLQTVGDKGLKVRLGDAGRTVTVSFDDDTIEQPSLRPGFTGTYRRK